MKRTRRARPAVRRRQKTQRRVGVGSARSFPFKVEGHLVIASLIRFCSGISPSKPLRNIILKAAKFDQVEQHDPKNT